MNVMTKLQQANIQANQRMNLPAGVTIGGEVKQGKFRCVKVTRTGRSGCKIEPLTGWITAEENLDFLESLK